jgi:hypothetical protein
MYAVVFELIIGTACGERIFYLYHRLGIQSNVIVSARYTNHAHRLTKRAVLAALRAVVEAHPMMRTIGVVKPSRKHKERHSLRIAMLHEIDLQQCVEFVDDQNETGVTPSIMEQAHNRWEHTSDTPERPLFKLVIVGQRDVMLVYHHMMADGMSGYVFHREFLAALNSGATSTPSRSRSSNLVCLDSTLPNFPPEWSQMENDSGSRDKRWHPSLIKLVMSQSSFFLSQLLCSSRFIFSGLPSSKPYFKSVTQVADDSRRTVTAVVNTRIPAVQVAKILAACRKNNTTFTPLLITMLMVVLSMDYNRKAWIGSTRFALDMRPHLPLSQPELGGGTELGTMFNCTSGMARVSRLAKYRRLVEQIDCSSADNEKNAYKVHSAGIWELTRQYKAWMTKETIPAVRAVRSSKTMSSDLEHVLYNIMPFAGTVLTSTSLVSNLGVFSGGADDLSTQPIQQQWSISDIQFSAAATNGRQGSQGPIFNVSGIRGGDTVINAAFEDGIISRQEVQSILDTVISRIITLTS